MVERRLLGRLNDYRADPHRSPPAHRTVAPGSKIKAIYRVQIPAGGEGFEPGSAPKVLPKALVRKLLPDLQATNGFGQEKVRGFGPDDANGETVFLDVGPGHGAAEVGLGRRIKLDIMKFEDACVSTEHRYSMGVETDSGRRYLAIPVSNRMVDYLEYYALTDAEDGVFHDDVSLAFAFAESCRRQEQDDRLFMQPGTDRGVPR